MPSTKVELEERHEQIRQWYAQGLTQHEMAKRAGVNQSQISRDLRTILDYGREVITTRQGEKAAEWIVEQLDRIDALERAAWQGYERSCTKRNKRRAKKAKTIKGNTEETTVEEEVRDGDPRFLERVGWCIEQRCKILGIHSTQSVVFNAAFQINNGDDRVQQLNPSEITELVRVLAAPPPSEVVEDTEGQGDALGFGVGEPSAFDDFGGPLAG